MFCEAVKVDMANTMDLSFNHTITSTHSLITVLFEDLFEAITLHRDFSGKKVDREPSTWLLNKTDTCDGYDFNIDIITDKVNAPQKESLMLFEGFLYLWLQQIPQKFALYFDGSEQDHIWKRLTFSKVITPGAL